MRVDTYSTAGNGELSISAKKFLKECIHIPFRKSSASAMEIEFSLKSEIYYLCAVYEQNLILFRFEIRVFYFEPLLVSFTNNFYLLT